MKQKRDFVVEVRKSRRQEKALKQFRQEVERRSSPMRGRDVATVDRPGTAKLSVSSETTEVCKRLTFAGMAAARAKKGDP